MLDRIRKVWRNAATPLKNLWSWAKRPKAKGQAKRFKALSDWARKKWREAKNQEAKAAWAVRKKVYRKRYRAAKERAKQTGEARWEPWMANGRDANVSANVKDFCARGVVNFDLYVTSLKRNYVPPGGSTTSYHLSGHAGDIAGTRMVAFQVSEYETNRGNGACWELFGPDNDAWLKHGADTGGAEGTPLEQLHDSHVHGAFA
jgi:hypothetical protein